jgi:hypothetical protein
MLLVNCALGKLFIQEKVSPEFSPPKIQQTRYPSRAFLSPSGLVAAAATLLQALSKADSSSARYRRTTLGVSRFF